jgi:hypothetical protein
MRNSSILLGEEEARTSDVFLSARDISVIFLYVQVGRSYANKRQMGGASAIGTPETANAGRAGRFCNPLIQLAFREPADGEHLYRF